jgi:hypothetical protein
VRDVRGCSQFSTFSRKCKSVKGVHFSRISSPQNKILVSKESFFIRIGPLDEIIQEYSDFQMELM